MRELRRMVATVHHLPAEIELRPAATVRPDSAKLHLPLIQCSDCHTTGWLSRLPNGLSRVATDLDEIYNAWFSSQPEVVRLYAQEGLKRPQCEVVAQRFCTQCGNLQVAADNCIACGHADLVAVFRVTARRTSVAAGGVVHTWHDTTCPACGGKQDPILLGARSATLGAVTIEQTWASPFNDDKKLIAFSDSVQDSAHRAGFFTARTYLNTVRTGLAKVIDQVAQPTCTWPDFLECAGAVWLEDGSPLQMPVERFVSEFIGPNMTWQRDWAEVLQKEDRLPEGSRLPKRVQKRLAWQAFAEFTYLSRRGRNLEAIGKAVLTPPLAIIEKAAAELLPVLHEQFGLRHLNQTAVLHWLWGFVCHLRMRGSVAHPEMTNFMADGNVFAFAKTGARREWLPGIGPKAAQPRFLSLGNDEHFDALTHQRIRTFYVNWAHTTLGAGGLFPEGAERELYLEAIRVLEEWRLLLRVQGRQSDVIAINPAELRLETRVARLVSAQGKRGITVPEADADRLLGMPCIDAPQEVYSHKTDGSGWQARQFSRGNLRRIYSAEHTGLLERDQREALEQRFKAKPPQPWYENLLSATPTLEMGVDIGDLSSVMLCSVPPNQASYLQRIGRAGRRDGNAFTSTLADGASPHDLYFFEDTDEMLSGEVVAPGIFLKAPEVLRRQLFAFCLDEWVGSGIADTALPDKTKEALDARDSDARAQFPYTFLDYVQAHEERLLTGFKALLGTDLDARVAGRLDGFMRGTEQEDGLKMRLSKLLDELANERKTHQKRAEQIKQKIRELKTRPEDEALLEEVERMERERQKAMELGREINQRELLNTLTDAGLIPNYAFPEAGVELKSLLWRKKSTDDPAGSGAYVSLPAERYERPANSALSEFAPENIFYANQRRVEVDQVNMQLSTIESWRLCPTCQHMRNLSLSADSDGACPRCGDPMWSNVSQKRQLLRFKQAIANSNDTEVRIDDSAEDREPKFYVRQMLSDFEVSDIREAYRLQSSETPFGFEFIERVVFRDVNFGETAKMGDSYAVAGKERARPGFKLCKQCGRVQRPPRNKSEREKPQLHTFDCPLRESDETTNLVECLYLYREFASEALRILMPYTRSGVDEVSVESFMAALRVGLKQRFGGKVDHLRMLTQEERGRDGAADRHYVLLYDSVPGGTGYLHELLADDAKTLIEALKLAHKHLTACACNADPEKDGCYRCVYQHRLGRAMALVSRNRARDILESLVGSLDQLERVQSVADIYVNPNFDSELESKFIESLRRLSGKERLPFIRLVQDIVQGKSGYLLEVSDQRYWIEPQVELGPLEGVEVMCKPDFVLWPAQSSSPRRPIAVFCDGWAFHQGITREDARKRNALVASGRFWVWSVTWEDVQSAIAEKVESDLAGSLDALFFQSVPPPWQARLDERLFQLHSVAGLVRWLAAATPDSLDPYALRMGRHAAAVAFKMLPPPHKPELEPARLMLSRFWDGVARLPYPPPDRLLALCGNVNDPGVYLRYQWPQDLVQVFAGQQENRLPVSPGFVVFDETAFENEPARHGAWRRWLWLFNVFQTLPGVLLATRAGLDNEDHADVTPAGNVTPGTGGGALAHAEGWEKVLAETLQEVSAELHRLRDAGVPAPEEVGYELAKGTQVIAEAELAWLRQKVVLLMDHHVESRPVWESEGWKTCVASGPWIEQLLHHFRPGPAGA
jgi:DEAD/DEAH box helicase domain-containing protein